VKITTIVKMIQKTQKIWQIIELIKSLISNQLSTLDLEEHLPKLNMGQ
jgi:hypothetical protein